MKRYIVLKPGISIDKTNGMAYNELVKHAEFIGVETGDGIMKDEIGGGTYSFHEIFNDNGNLRNTFEKSSVGVYICENLVFYGKEYKISLKKNGNPAGDFVGSIRWNLNLKEQAIVSPIGTVLSALGFVCESRETCYLYRMPGDSSFQGTILKSKFGMKYLDEVSVVNFEKGIGKYFTYTVKNIGSIDDGTMVKEIDITIPEGSGNTPIAVGNGLTGYSGKSPNTGRDYQIDNTSFSTYRYGVINNVIKPYYNYSTSPDWWMPEHMTKVTVNTNAYDPNMTPYPVTSNDVSLDAHGMLVNTQNRYWIAVGPTIMNAQYKSNNDIDPVTMKYGCEIDLLLEHLDTNPQPQQVWLHCTLGDAKNHTFDGYVNGTYIDGQGIFQTGFDPQGNWASGNMDASIIEFMGIGQDNALKELSKYKLVKIVVYDL